ncbi:MAG TPA: hypothetical protein DCS15_09260 [Flavobacteriales bacterium]|jgi:NadR type nicotinamide-nucleotide adenylyltransferase|nr:ATP-binding protein [Salibacteraceae bacterium]HAS36663.1 hypothetical protein [Flavobacteriales bacterium]
MEKKPIRIAVIGPESTGKSTLAKKLADHFGALYIPEFARTYLEENGATYELQDLDKIILGQEEAMKTTVESHIVFDTDLLSLYLWKKEKYALNDLSLLNHWSEMKIDVFLLCNTDVPWVFDPLRESEGKRNELFDAHMLYLNVFKKNFNLIEGTGEARTQNAIQFLREFIQ